MFGPRFFGRYFGARYFGNGSDSPAVFVAPEAKTTLIVAGGPRILRTNQRVRTVRVN